MTPPGRGGAAFGTETFTDPAVRDLAWLLFAPGLLDPARAGAPLADPLGASEAGSSANQQNHPPDTALYNTLDFLHALDRDPAALHARVHRPTLRRLGFYAEALLEFFLQHGPAARLVAANVPLRRAGVTLGECDFLLQTPRGARLHWELAVKFYLHAGNAASFGHAPLAGYVGPNLKDRFDLKYARLIGHQLTLSARDEFAALGYAGPWRAELFIKGRLFYRRGEPAGTPDTADSPIAHDHPRGWWMTASEWQAFYTETARAGATPMAAMILPRLAWLAPRAVSAADMASLSDQQPALAARLARPDGPVMLAEYSPDANGVWAETSRGFVVPDDWPERARDYALSGS